jgi:hypothetical protein
LENIGKNVKELSKKWRELEIVESGVECGEWSGEWRELELENIGKNVNELNKKWRE